MSAQALLSELSDRGIRVRPNGQKINLSPKEALTPELIDRIKSEKPGLLRELERVRKEAGEDWDEIANDPAQLKAFAELLMISEMRSQGIAPDHYTATATCTHCGPVPIWESCPPEVNGCPWCLNRVAGLPIPETN